jgi:uncharacterized protein (DUF1697 family)
VTRYFCFLRAINVGGHTVTMPTLKKLFEAMGFRNVETFIASGNVIFETSKRDPRKLEALISRNLHKSLGYEVHSFVRTRGDLAAVEAFRPFAADKMANAVAYHVGFGTGPYGAAHKKSVAGLQTATDDLLADGHEIYWACTTRSSNSKVSGGAIEKALGGRTTLRNINTVRRLLAKYPE